MYTSQVDLFDHTTQDANVKRIPRAAAESIMVPSFGFRHSPLAAWTRIGRGPVSLARDFVLFTDYSPCPPYREPVRGPAAADDDFSVTLAADVGGPLRIRSRDPIRTIREWSRHERLSSGTSRGYRTPMIEETCRGNRPEIQLYDLATAWALEEESREDPSISRVLESLRWLGGFLETNVGCADFGFSPVSCDIVILRIIVSTNACRSSVYRVFPHNPIRIRWQCSWNETPCT